MVDIELPSQGVVVAVRVRWVVLVAHLGGVRR